MSDVDTMVADVAAHRPYGLDCKCGRPINSDADWARHLVEVLGLREEWSDDIGGPDWGSHCRMVSGSSFHPGPNNSVHDHNLT